MDPESATLWFAGKQLLGDKKLAEYMGRNERTRAIVKLQKKGQSAPAREPVSGGGVGGWGEEGPAGCAAAATAVASCYLQGGTPQLQVVGQQGAAPAGAGCSVLQMLLQHVRVLTLLRVCPMQVVDADTQKAMMAYYFKKQEEQKVGGRGRG